MKSKLRSPFLIYFLLGSFILGWWTIAFYHTPLSTTSIVPPETKPLQAITSHEIIRSLSDLERSCLHQALSGNVEIMINYISQWDQDAKILKEKFGIGTAKRLSQKEYLKSQILAHLILTLSPDELKKINLRIRKSTIIDANGRQIHLQDSFCRFLPQTYMTADILLAIAKPHEIVAIPKGLRSLDQIHSNELLEQIPLNVDRCLSEKLFLANPHVAFVAPYSHPSALQALTKQKILLYNVQTIRSIRDIQEALLKVGHICNHPLEAELLSIFIEAGLYSIDNRLKALSTIGKQTANPKMLLYLCHCQQYHMPTTKCISGQLLKRALENYSGFITPCVNGDYWMAPYDMEKIFRNNPDYLILSIVKADATKSRLKHQRALHPLTACRNGQVSFVDEAFQDSTSQFVVLAYYDLYESIEKSIKAN